jgi:hypothetical protein
MFSRGNSRGILLIFDVIYIHINNITSLIVLHSRWTMDIWKITIDIKVINFKSPKKVRKKGGFLTVKRSITTTELQKYIFCVGERLFYCQGEKGGGLKNEKNNNLIPVFNKKFWWNMKKKNTDTCNLYKKKNLIFVSCEKKFWLGRNRYPLP